MKVIKRDDTLEQFDKNKIKIAIIKSMKTSIGIKSELAEKISNEIENECKRKNKEEISVYDIEKIVYNKLIDNKLSLVAKSYEDYRSIREFQRECDNSTDEEVIEMLQGTSEYWTNENSNKNSKIQNVKRDYLAGILSTDIARRFMMPPDLTQAHDEGIIHQHDMDYIGQGGITNCCLINLEDMLQNGTVINNVKIDKPHTLKTATTIATQIITSVASSQYGGCTITLTHLAPFVRDSYNKYIKKYKEWGFDSDKCEEYAKIDLKKEVEDSVQTFNYQVNSMSTTNGQAPFLSVYMYLNETTEYKKELAMLIEEFLKQRIKGIKNEAGVYVTQTFPKLIYALESDNICEGTPYYYLTKLSAECTAKRFVPDYVSEKITKKYKENTCPPSMGCVDGTSLIDYKIGDERYVETFERAWNRLSNIYEIKFQPNKKDFYIETPNVSIWDNKENSYVKQYRIIRNSNNNWYHINFTNGREIDVTNNHPFEVEEKGVVFADDTIIGDKIKRNIPSIKNISFSNQIDNISWLKGLILCDGCYDEHLTISLGIDEKDIVDKAIEVLNSLGYETQIVVRNRGVKGNYIDLKVKNSKELRLLLTREFEGIKKIERHIPKNIFSSNDDIKMSFLSGMIDADGYINSSGNSVKVQIGSTNKELAYQQMQLALDLGIDAFIYENHYNKKNSSKIRYRVEFNAIPEIKEYLISTKKKNHFVDRHNFKNVIKDECLVESIESYVESKYSYDVTTESEHFTVNGIYSHNCRSWLPPYRDSNGNYKYYGRFNCGVCTINLFDVALSSNGDYDSFWKLMEERSELVHRALQVKLNSIKGTLSDVAPILWQNGAFARLQKHEPIDKLLYNGYCTISYGYAGLYECVKFMTGNSHSDGSIGEKFGLEVMQFINDKCNQWYKEEGIQYSVYGSPIESTTYKFAKCLKKRFGNDVFTKLDKKDRNYITNSYHLPVFEKINAYDKLSIESKFQGLSTGGAISYIEAVNTSQNIDSVLNIMKFIYNNIPYAEINIKTDFCQVCGYTGEIKLDSNLEWYCPNCGNKDHDKMNVVRRTCGL